MTRLRLSPLRWLRAGVVASVALCGTLCAQAPDYIAAGIVNASDFSPEPFAPGSVLSLFGINLSWTTESTATRDPMAAELPTELAGIQVYVDHLAAPLLYASPTQINFLMPVEQIPGDVSVTVVRQATHGPAVTIALIDAAPALFVTDGGFAVAQDWNAGYAVMTASAPAHAGDIVVLYATGLGRTNYWWASGEVPRSASNILALASLRVLLNGTAIDPTLVLYAGVTPGFPGLYQINFTLPANVDANPEIRVQVGARVSIPAIQLAVE